MKRTRFILRHEPERERDAALFAYACAIDGG